MRITLHVSGGPGTGRSGQAGPGRPLYVGRGVMAHLRVPDDPDLLNVHFEIECSEATCRMRDMSGPAGTKVNGNTVRAAELKDGDVITAGRSTFEVRAVAAPAPAPAAPAPVAAAPVVPAPLEMFKPQPPAAAGPQPVLKVLREQADPLFALLDAARDPLIYAALLTCGEKHQSLYEGQKALELSFVAPYLVQLSPDKPFTESLLTAGWGKSWGVFLTCKEPFDAVRKHLRHFLMVRMVGGKQVYFRFYDPRVLRAFLPSCSPDECTTFFGPLSAYLMEAEQPTALLRMTARDKPATVAVTPPG